MMGEYNNRKSQESLLIQIYAVAVVGLARPDAERDAEGGAFVHAAIRFFHFRLV